MPRVTERTAQLVRKRAHLARQVRLSLTQMRGHRIPERSNNNGVGSGGLDNRGAKNGESGDHRNQPGAAGVNAKLELTKVRMVRVSEISANIPLRSALC